jgi:Asp-tRNA(Asn)/Glu-tRNA(Gln) amidotransferase A subunit family amidase
MALCWSMDKIGPICRSVADTALVLSVLNGADPRDRDSIEAPFACDLRAGVAGLRVGYLPAAFADPCATATDLAVLAAVRGLGLDPVALELPDLPYGSLMNILYAEAAAAFEDLTLEDRDDRLTWQEADAWPNIFRKARFLSAVDHVQTDRLRWQVMLALDRLFADVDVLIGPFNTGPMLVASNFTGHPCLHLRAGFADLATRAPGSLAAGHVRMSDATRPGPRHRVPQGISIWAGLFDEGAAIRLGLALERRLGAGAERPPGFGDPA